MDPTTNKKCHNFPPTQSRTHTHTHHLSAITAPSLLHPPQDKDNLHQCHHKLSELRASMLTRCDKRSRQCSEEPSKTEWYKQPPQPQLPTAIVIIMILLIAFLPTAEARTPGIRPSDRSLHFDHTSSFNGHTMPIIPSDAVRLISINVNGGLTTSWQALLGKHRFAIAHKFTDCMKYKQDLRADLMCIQETGGTRDLSNIISAKLLKGFGRFIHSPSQNAHTAGLAIIADKNIAPRIHGGHSNETGTIQISQLATTASKKRKAKHHLTIFNIYAPTSPTSSNARWCDYMDWLEALATKVEEFTTAGNSVLIIGDWNIAPNWKLDRQSNPTQTTLPTNREKELELWNRITTRLNMVDIYRHFHPNKRPFSYTSYNSQAHTSPTQSRIDLALCRPDDLDIIKRIAYDTKPKIAHTDHTPLIIDLKPEYTHVHIKKTNKPPKRTLYSLTKMFQKPNWLNMKKLQNESSEFDTLCAPQDSWDNNLTVAENLNSWMRKFHRAMNSCIIPPEGELQAKPNTGHAFWKKEYNAIAAQGKTLKQAIDLLNNRHPNTLKAHNILKTKCPSITPPALLSLLKLPEPSTQTLQEARTILKQIRTSITKDINYSNRKRHAQVTTDHKNEIRSYGTDPDTLKRFFPLVSLKNRQRFPLQSTWVQNEGQATLSILQKIVTKAADVFFQTIFNCELTCPITPTDCLQRDWHKATQYPTFMKDYLSSQILAPTEYRGPATRHITASDVTNKLASLGKNKAGGNSGLTNDILFNSDTKVHAAIANLLNICLKEGKVPSEWYTAVILTIPKIPHPSGLGDTRPIALLEVLSKLLTSFMADSMSQAWYNNNILDDTQHSSLPGHSVSAPLHIVRCIYEEAAEERKTSKNPRHLHVLYCDYAKAFDSIPNFIVDAALRTLGVPEHFITLFNHMDTNAWNRISTDHGLSAGFHPQRGIRQGDSASPLRFIAVLNILMHKLKQENRGWKTTTGEIVFGHAYADDCWLVAENHEDLQAMANIVADFCNTIHLGINHKKSYYSTTDPTAPDIFFPQINNLEPKPATKVPPSAPVRYLGIHISLDLRWKSHITIMDEHIKAICKNLEIAPITYPQAQIAVNLMLGGFANFHFQYVDIPRTTIRAWDNKIYAALNSKLSLPPGTAHLQHSLPCLAGKNYFRTLESLWDGIQVGETFIRINDTNTLVSRLTRQRLLSLCEHRGSVHCCLRNPTASKSQRSHNHIVAVENSLAHLGMSIDTDTILSSIQPSRSWDITLHDAIPPHIFPHIAPELKKRNLYYIGDLADPSGTNFSPLSDLKTRGLFKRQPPLWIHTLTHNLCLPNTLTLRPRFRVSSHGSQTRPNPPSCANPATQPTQRHPIFTAPTRTANPYSFSITKPGAIHIYITDGSRIRVNGRAQSGFATVPLQNGTHTIYAKPDGKQCNSKTEALGLLSALMETPPTEEGCAFLDNSGVIQVFARGEPLTTRHKLRTKNRTTFMAIWESVKTRPAPFKAHWIVGHSKRKAPVYDAQRLADHLAGAANHLPNPPSRRFPLHDVPFLTFLPDQTLIEDDVRTATIKQGILHQLHTAKTKAIIQKGSISQLHSHIDSLTRPTTIDKHTQDIITSGNKASIKFMFELRSNKLYTRERLHKLDQLTTTSPMCPNCENNTQIETNHHAVHACPIHAPNNAKTIFKVVDILLNIPDPISDIWKLQPPELTNIQPWLDANWPSQLRLTTQTIRPQKSKPPPPDPFASDLFLKDGSIDIETLLAANILGETKKQDTLEQRPAPQPDTTLTIQFTSQPTLPHVKLSRFLELWHIFKQQNKIPPNQPGPPLHNTFLKELINTIRAECPENDNSTRPLTGQDINHQNFWAADRGLTNLLVKIGITTERFSSPLNHNHNFTTSYSAREEDKAFGLKYDGLHCNTHNNTQTIRKRDFAADTSSYNNPEYTNDMMHDTMMGCFNAIQAANDSNLPTRHVMLIPFVPGNANHHLFRYLHAQAPQDVREWIVFPPRTYYFWQFGYWLGTNKLAKREDLTYRQGNLALIVFDNKKAREIWPITTQMHGEFAQWAKTKLPFAARDKISWKNELAPVKKAQPRHDVHARSEFLFLSAVVARWCRNPDDNPNTAFNSIDLARSTPPQWLCDKLQVAGLSKIEANAQATKIAKIIRQGMINNWTHRHATLPPRNPDKLIMPQPTSHSSFSKWGKTISFTPIAHTPNPSPPNTPSSPTQQNSPPRIITKPRTNRRPPAYPTSPSKSLGKSLGLPKHRRNKTLQKTLTHESRLDARIAAYCELKDSPQTNLGTITCNQCRERPAIRYWPDPQPSHLCGPCRHSTEASHPNWNATTYPTSCIHCGTHHPGSKPWLRHSSLIQECAICTHCRPKPNLNPLSPPQPLLRQSTIPTSCEACRTPLQNRKKYTRSNVTLCSACYTATTCPYKNAYALTRFQLRMIGYHPNSFQELHTHDRLLHVIFQQNNHVTHSTQLTQYQTQHIMNYLQHQTHHNQIRTPTDAALSRTAKTISLLPHIAPHPATHRHECPFCFLRIPDTWDRVTHVHTDCPALGRALNHPTRPPD